MERVPQTEEWRLGDGEVLGVKCACSPALGQDCSHGWGKPGPLKTRKVTPCHGPSMQSLAQQFLPGPGTPSLQVAGWCSGGVWLGVAGSLGLDLRGCTILPRKQQG